MNSKDTSSEKEELNSKKSKNHLMNIKSFYFLQKLFDYMLEKKQLKIAKINKSIQNRLNININNYKKYSETYSSIELEIIPIENGEGPFLNYSGENREYIHVYFDDNKIEIPRNFLNEKENVSKIKMIIGHEINSFSLLFFYCKGIKAVKFKKFCRKNIAKMNGMFEGCSSLEEIDFANFNTDNVTNMSHMFDGCSSLKKINFTNFNTGKVVSMNHMFNDCSSLKELNLSNFNTDNVINMEKMFCGCT